MSSSKIPAKRAATDSKKRPAMSSPVPSHDEATATSRAITPPFVDLSQYHDDEIDDVEEEEEEERQCKIASCSATIVGIRYYSGKAHAGEYVNLVREPQNPYDRNAIRVDNLQHIKVGHIKKQQAAILAPFMDESNNNNNIELEFEGTIPYRGNEYTLPLQIDFIVRGGTSITPEQFKERSEALAKALQKAFKRRHDFQSLVDTSSKSQKKKAAVAQPTEPIVESKRIDWSMQANELDKMFDQNSAQQLENLPNIPMPSSQLKTELLDYQQVGLKWLVQNDTTPKVPCFYSEQKENNANVWHCSITKSSQTNKPRMVQGGLLCDEMGLGKTLQMIALFLAAPPKDNAPTQCTLIVCPVSVMSNWQHQIEQHVQAGILNVGVYQGSSRSKLLQKVEDGEINVLLVSYHTLASDYTKVFGKPNANNKNSDKIPARPSKKQKKNSIFGLSFHRIVCDEAHVIRNPRSRFFHACNQVSAERRWALSGTPFVNRCWDIFSLLVFLGFEPLNDKKIFQRAIASPIENGEEETGMACLRVAMSNISLRRSKATAGIKLADKTVRLTKVTFQDESSHKAIYDALFGSVRIAFQAVLQDGDKGILKNYSNIFEKLLRLRQACCSGVLVPLERRQRALEVWRELQQRSSDDDTPNLTAQEGLELLEKLKGAFSKEANGNNELPECAICLMEMEEGQCIILKKCSHVYCEPCLTRVCTNDTTKSNCPLCRQPFSKADMIKRSVASAATQVDLSNKGKPAAIDNGKIELSPKISALLATIKTDMEPDEKGVIFSQFTSFLDLIGTALQDVGHTFVRVDGSMNTTKRTEAVQAFSSDDEDGPRFILCSLHAAGTGINLTRGSKAFMMDCWWNSSVENQAMDRIHRIGQQRACTIHRFIMKGSIEERIVDLQVAKSLQAKGSMQKLKAEEQKKSRLRDLKGLLMIE